MFTVRERILGGLDSTFAFPVWLMTNLTLRVVPKTHPWHKRWFTLLAWRLGRTGFVKVLDLLIWESTILVPILIYRLYHPLH